MFAEGVAGVFISTGAISHDIYAVAIGTAFAAAPIAVDFVTQVKVERALKRQNNTDNVRKE